MKNLLKIAAFYANKQSEDKRQFRLGAIGIRNDGRMVHAANSPSQERFPPCHAEARLCKKLTPNSIVVVARITRDGKMAMARPCDKCFSILKTKKVKKVYYSISETEYGCLLLN